jgi:hypothetical protein
MFHFPPAVLAVLDEKKLLKVIRRSLPHCSKLGNSQKVHGMNSQKFSFGKPPWQGGCVFENQFRLRLAHGMHLDFQNLINMPNLRQYGEARGGKRPVAKRGKIMFSLSRLFFFGITENARSGFMRFFNLYDKSRPENQTTRGEINSVRTLSKFLVYVFCSKRIDFRAILRNTLETPLVTPLSVKPNRLIVLY